MAMKQLQTIEISPKVASGIGVSIHRTVNHYLAVAVKRAANQGGLEYFMTLITGGTSRSCPSR